MPQYYLHDRDSIQRAINALKDVYTELQNGANHRFVMNVGPVEEPYTDAQRKKCHAWFDEIAEATGNLPADVKDGLMQIFFTEEPYTFASLDKETGEVKEITLYRRQSFTNLSKKKVSEFMDNVSAWAAEQGIILE